MPINLETPIVNDRTVSINFFNGRLLSGEDLTAEQKANRASHDLLGLSVGEGIVRGLEVAVAAELDSVTNPVVLVKSGVAINRKGHVLALNGDTQVALTRPTETISGTSLFRDCTPPQTGASAGAYVAAARVYLLVISPITAVQGTAPVSGLGNVTSPCVSKYRSDAVQFRLIHVQIDSADLANANLLRNRLAYRCFSASATSAVVKDVFGPGSVESTLLETLRPATLTDCDVPLCLLHWTATGGIRFIDRWSVRRLIDNRATTGKLRYLLSDARSSEGAARVVQFQEHLEDLRNSGVATETVVANQYFQRLPSIGLLPLAGTAFARGFNIDAFFSGQTFRGPFFIAESQVPWMFAEFSSFSPLTLGSGELIWVYLVRENSVAANRDGTAQPYCIFASGYTPYAANSRYDISQWDLGNYSLVVSGLDQL